MIIGTPKECNTTKISSRKSPTAIDKQYETRSAISAIRTIISNNNCFDHYDTMQNVFYSCCYGGR
jgi:hypothetical protein